MDSPSIEPEQGARARTLFQEARWLVAAGRFSEACPLFEQSLWLEMGLGTKFNLADCWERLGRTASAHALFAGVAAEAELSVQPERARIARARAQGLEARIPKLTVDVEPTPGVSVRIDRVVLEEAAWGVSRPIDPGPHRIEARAPGGQRWTKDIDVPPGGTLVSVSVPVLVQRAPETPKSLPKPTPPPRLSRQPLRFATREDVTPKPSSSSTVRTIALGLGTLGAGALAVGGYYALKYRSHDADARSICADGGTCTREDIARHDALVESSRKASTRAFVAAGSGAAVLTSAAILLLVSSSRTRGPRVGAAMLPDGSWSISAEGAF